MQAIDEPRAADNGRHTTPSRCMAWAAKAALQRRQCARGRLGLLSGALRAGCTGRGLMLLTAVPAQAAVKPFSEAVTQ